MTKKQIELIRKTINQEYVNNKADFMDYIKDRERKEDGYSSPEDYLENVCAEGDYENTIREQAYLKGFLDCINSLQRQGFNK